MEFLVSALPCTLFEDDHLLVVNKPAGLNTHSPAPFSGEGIYEHLRHREPRWSGLSIIHRLDKETSGVIVFSKTTTANQLLARQFETRQVRKKYLFLTDRPVRVEKWNRVNRLKRAGERYVGSDTAGEPAETVFEIAREAAELGKNWQTELRGNAQGEKRGSGESVDSCVIALWAKPITGRTHQIRVHAAESGCPILGDTLYGGTPAHRLCLHAAEIRFRHPETNELLTFSARPDFQADTRDQLRAALIDPAETNAFRLVHGASDGWPGWYLDAFGDFLLSQSAGPVSKEQGTEIARHLGRLAMRGAAHKTLERHVRKVRPAEASPLPEQGEFPVRPFVIRENGLQYELSFNEGYSTGLFLDQRDNRRRVLTGHIAARFSLPSPFREDGSRTNVLNAFAYTCAFSVCAAKKGYHVTSLDLSRKYLDWGRRNFALNELGAADHEFIYGDVFDWLRRWEKKQRKFDLVILDPPTFSQSRESGVFRAEKDFGKLVRSALTVLSPGGVLFSSTNVEDWPVEKFLNAVRGAVTSSHRRIHQEHYATQPPDFPVSRSEPAYLKTVWMRLQKT